MDQKNVIIVEYKITFNPIWDVFPILKLKHRKSNEILYTTENCDLDKYSSIFMKDHWTFTTEGRLRSFNNWLKKECKNDMDRYIQLIMADKYLNKKQYDSLTEQMQNLTTNGWKKLTVKIND